MSSILIEVIAGSLLLAGCTASAPAPPSSSPSPADANAETMLAPPGVSAAEEVGRGGARPRASRRVAEILERTKATVDAKKTGDIDALLSAIAEDKGQNVQEQHVEVIGGEKDCKLECDVSPTAPRPIVQTAAGPQVKSAPPDGNVAVGAVLIGSILHCTATLIGSRTMLTAAHCLVGRDPRTLSVFFGYDARNRPPGSTFEVVDAWSSDHFDAKTAEHDVGMLCLRSKVPNIIPVQFPRAPVPNTAYAGQSLLFVGFGFADERPGERMGQRRRVKIPVHLDPKGALTYGDGVHDTCYADSGGPAFLGNQLVGITSNGAERCGGGGVDARVDQHLDFIDQKQTACNQK